MHLNDASSWRFPIVYICINFEEILEVIHRLQAWVWVLGSSCTWCNLVLVMLGGISCQLFAYSCMPVQCLYVDLFLLGHQLAPCS